jgi:hypothetical protein
MMGSTRSHEPPAHDKSVRMNLVEAVRESTSYRRVAKKLGTNHNAVKKAIELAALDVAHFDFGRRSMNYVGKKVNRLTIKEVFKKERRWFCRCECECGSPSVEKRLDGVLSGHVPSCGCAYRSRPMMNGARNPAFSGCGEILGSRMYWIRRGAERRGLTFEITKEFIWKLFEEQNRRCALSGVELYFGRMYHSHETTASLDRKDNSKGYVVGNVQWVHKDVNRLKRDLNEEYFLAWCHRISEHNCARRPDVLKGLAG